MINTASRLGVRQNRVVSALRGQVPRKMVTAASGGSNSLTASALNATGIGVDMLLTGILPSTSDQTLRKFFRDIYDFDCVGGSYVDLMSNLPFSDFTLVGSDASGNGLKVHEDAVNRLNLRQLFPELSINYLVDGMFVGNLVYDAQKKNFMDILTYDPQDLKFTELPFYALDPVITVKNDSRVQNFLQSDAQAVKQYRDRLPTELMRALQADEYQLDPLMTLFLPRRTDARSVTGTSVYRRILPVYLLEKILFRGTLVEAAKRQRAMLHATAGTEDWVATPEELEAIVNIFQQAELDPLGAVVATRDGIELNEIRQGGDFWKITDIYDVTTQMKLRAFGTSETFLGGEANFSTAEVNMTVFLESLKYYRDMVTYRVFKSKLFPTISMLNELTRKGGEKENLQDVADSARAQDRSNLFIPSVRWHKQLEPRDNKDLLDVLDKLTDMGVPVPVRMMLAAGAIDPETYLTELTDDIEWNKKLTDVKKRMAEATEAPDDEGGAFARLNSVANLAYHLSKKPKQQGMSKRILGKQYEGMMEVSGRTVTGKRTAIVNQTAAHHKENEVMAKAAKNLSDPNHRQSLLQKLAAANVMLPVKT